MPLAASFPPPGSAPDPPGGSIPPGPPDPGASCRAKPRPARGPVPEPLCEGSGGIMPPAAGGIFSSPGRCPGPAGGNPSPRSPRPGGIVPRKPRPARGPVPKPLCEGSGGIMPPAAGGIFSSPGRCPGPAGGNPSPRSPRPGGIVPRKAPACAGTCPRAPVRGVRGHHAPGRRRHLFFPRAPPRTRRGESFPPVPPTRGNRAAQAPACAGTCPRAPVRGVRGHHAPGRRRHLFIPRALPRTRRGESFPPVPPTRGHLPPSPGLRGGLSQSPRARGPGASCPRPPEASSSTHCSIVSKGAFGRRASALLAMERLDRPLRQ